MGRRLLLALLVLLAVPSAASASVDVGVGRADITPPTGYYMMGWVRSDAKIEGQNTRLWARVIVLRQGGRKIALVAEDLNGIPGGMLAQAAAMDRDIGFSEQNVLDSASHTHAAPSGFYNFSTYNTVFMTLNSPTDFQLTGAIDKQLYAFMVRRLALAIRRANANLGRGAVGWGTTSLTDITANRSIEAHLADFGIHLPYGQGNPDMDPKGRLDTIDPEGHVLRVDKYFGRRRVPVGIWSTFANHGTVNRFQFTYYNEDHHGAASQGVESALRRSGRVPPSQDVVTVYGNSDEGDMSAGLTRAGPAAADFVGKAEATGFLSAWREAGRHMTTSPKLDWRWTRMCFCGQMTAAGAVAGSGAFGLAEFTGSEEGRGPLFDITHQPLEGINSPVSNGAQGQKLAAPIPVDAPTAVPLMAVRVGDRAIVSVPGEMTVEMGRRVRAATLDAARGGGIAATIISGLANEYTSYFTTPEEFDAQHYEGAATIYGRTSSVAIQEALVALIRTLADGTPAPPAYAYDSTNGVSPVGDAFSSGASAGAVVAQPAASVARLGHPELSWTGGPRGYDRPLDSAFVTMQRRVTLARATRPRPHRRHAPAYAGRARFRWVTADSDLGLDIVWRVDANGRYTARWEVPLNATPGRYRFVITANRYRLVSRDFQVTPLRTLALSRSGGSGLRLGYPQAVEHEQLGDPAGDFTADLTYRPQYAPSGTATVLLNGKRVAIHWHGGSLAIPASPGTQVQVPAGSVRDRFGNANGGALSFTAAG
jgi:neutral ceramidase